MQKIELIKLKKQVSDQRREYAKLPAKDSRIEHLLEEILDEASHLNEQKPLTVSKNLEAPTNREAVLCINDLHYGLVTDNIWNVFNINIFNQRLTELVEKVIWHIKENKVRKLHILVLGDLCHGSIHTGCRVASEEVTSRQLMQVTEKLAEVINVLSEHVSETNVYCTYGNHMRTIQNKAESIHDDNMEQLVPWWLDVRFENRNDINIVPGEWYEFIRLYVCGASIVAVHGDLEKFNKFGSTMNSLFTKKFNQTIDLAVMADKHHKEEFEEFGIESILLRSFCGTEEFANGNRLYSTPAQSLMIFNDDEGFECKYDIKFK